ncbi:iron-siderophore ABC transporter substrate-binding protein [Leptolyngbya sp. 7M]|uniref:iron-siderophore ABC transporter substrate-binding protein n=1 Tax=Leptolyngbya sp. 7M TaxID=2812896 RepID=UPI001B8DA1B7|nr:iron-siderophore ABC transporter substrate-binding protein [Leptolyngbya sp. 7M]QYO62970.1 iron-siderophore ABC transporter substrate-binding protein [Leptolyngbya sp. 7M]
MGETCVPNPPQRLVTLSQFTLANVLALGFKPVGSTSNARQVDFPAYLKNEPQGIKKLGREEAPNLEGILLLKPDLILGKDNSEAIYPHLSQIAPTVLGKWESTPSWREHFNFVAEVLDRKELAQQLWKRYNQRIQALKVDLDNRYQNQQISVIRISNDGSIVVDAKNSFVGSILNDIGLQRPKLQEAVGLYGVAVSNLSEENLNEIDGDILFILTFTDDDRNKLQDLQRKPLWQTLRAVQQGKVYLVEGETWVGSTILAADAVINDLYKYLVNTP